MNEKRRGNNIDEGPEKLVLIVNTIIIIFLAGLLYFDKGTFVSPLIMVVLMIVCWAVTIIKSKPFPVRAAIHTILSQISLAIFAMYVDNLIEISTIQMAFVVAVGLYGLYKLTLIGMISTTIVLAYHFIFFAKPDPAPAYGDVMVVLQIVGVYFLQYYIYTWSKKRYEAGLRMMNVIKLLEQAQASKDDFLANISHEVRTPINTICGMSELLLQKDIDASLKNDILSIQSAGRSLTNVVSDILDFSELQSDRIKIENENYNLSSTINDVMNMAMAKRGDRDIEIIVDCDIDVPSVLYGDEKKIRRVLNNLINNALKFTTEGYISLSVSCRREEYGVNLTFTVSDSGIGISDENLEAIFATFNQLDSQRTRQTGGIGLGLSISQKLVHKMGGVLTVKSRYGVGSRFQFVVPQELVDETPIASVENGELLNVAVYVDMEQFVVPAVRDEYGRVMLNIVSNAGIKNHICRNLAELKRRLDNSDFTHVVISYFEYDADRAYFDELSERMYVLIILFRYQEHLVNNPRLKRVYKPFYGATIINALKAAGQTMRDSNDVENKKMIAPNVKVLVVDDNDMNIQVIKGLLDNYRITVVPAHSGMEALELIESKDFDFVFMDHMMPGMDGVEAFHKIRGKIGTYFKKVPVIALTANAVAGSREMFINEGFADFVDKPVEKSVLERVLKRIISPEKLIYVNAGDEIVKNSNSTDNSGEVVVNSNLIDMESGIMYCGGRDNYFKLLPQYLLQGKEDLRELANMLEAKDWKNYTIRIHAVKSSMASIGAKDLSACAKALEMAGKNEDYAYIEANHDTMADKYHAVIEQIKVLVGGDSQSEAEMPKRIVQEITEDKFNELLVNFENAMYELNGETMLEIVELLENSSYKGEELSVKILPVRRKVELSDYMSAMELLYAVKEA